MSKFNKYLVFIVLITIMLSSSVFSQMNDARKENKIGLEMLSQNKPQQAISHFRKALKIDEIYAEPYFNLGKAYKLLGDKAQEIKYYYIARDKMPSSLDVKKAIYEYHFLEAKENISTGNTEKGLEILENLLKETRKPTEIYSVLMETAYKNQDYKKLSKYTKDLLTLRIKGKVGDEPEVILANFYFAYMKQKASDEFGSFKRYMRGVMLLNKYSQRLKKYKGRESILKLKNKIEGSNKIIQKFSAGKKFYKNKNYSQARDKFSSLCNKYNKISIFKEWLNKAEEKIKMESTLQEVTSLVTNANSLNEDTEKQRSAKKEVLLSAKHKLDEAITLGASGEVVKTMENTIKQMIDKCDNPELKFDYSKEQFERNMKAFAAITGDSGQEKYMLDKIYAEAEKAYDMKDYNRALSLYNQVLSEVEDRIQTSCPKCGEPNPKQLPECENCGESLVIPGNYKNARGKADECRVLIKKKDQEKTGLIIGAVFGAIALTILLLYLKKELPKRNKNKKLSAAQAYFEAKKYKKAINYFVKVQDYPLSPRESIKVNLGLAQCHYKLEKYDQAIKYGQIVLRNEERNEQARVVIAKSYLGKKYISDTALFEYKFLINLEPNNQELLELLCNYYIKKEIVNKDAVSIYKKMHKLDPSNKEVLNILGLSYMEEGRTDSEAQVTYEEILRFSPEKIEFRKMLIEIYFEKELWEDVIKECKNIFKVDVDDKRLHNMFYDAFINLRRITEGILYYEELSQSFPNKKNLKKMADKLKEKRHMNPELDENSSGISEQDRQKINQAKTSGQTISICPKCAKLNPLGATICTECGASLVIE